MLFSSPALLLLSVSVLLHMAKAVTTFYQDKNAWNAAAYGQQIDIAGLNHMGAKAPPTASFLKITPGYVQTDGITINLFTGLPISDTFVAVSGSHSSHLFSPVDETDCIVVELVQTLSNDEIVELTIVFPYMISTFGMEYQLASVSNTGLSIVTPFVSKELTLTKDSSRKFFGFVSNSGQTNSVTLQAALNEKLYMTFDNIKFINWKPCGPDDSDGDGTPDCMDECPNDPDKKERGECGCNCIDECPDDTNKILAGKCGCGTPETDSDNDGVQDCLDECPGDPAKTLEGNCGCGLSEMDQDGDGVQDCFDECPYHSAKSSEGHCGCDKPETDTDSDGTPDCGDACSQDSEKTVPGYCGCGEVETDSDGDGVPDCKDECPLDDQKTEKGACGCGAPDTYSKNEWIADCCLVDSDGDGDMDCYDKCPQDKTKMVPGVCGCGVPDGNCNPACMVDSDSDGVSDCDDGCPQDLEKTDPGYCGCGISEEDADGNGVPDCADSCSEDAARGFFSRRSLFSRMICEK
jgi:hypothetical protein